MVGPTKGPCEKFAQPGWKQSSIVDPMSPALKIFCKKHHEEHDEPLKPRCRIYNAYANQFLDHTIPFCDIHHNFHDHQLY